MKRLCFFNTTSFWGGGEKFYLEAALEFRQRGYEVILVCRKGSFLAQQASQHGLPQFHISISNRSFLNPFKLLRLRKFYSRNKIDAVIFSTSQDLKAGGLSAHLAGLQRIVYRRGLAVPIKNRPLNRYLFKQVLTHIVANSEETKGCILQHLSPYIHPDRIRVIYNGLKLSGPKVHTSSYTGTVLGNAGRLTAQKGQEDLIEMAQILKNKGHEFSLLIAGEGELYTFLQQLIQEKDLEEQVKLLGFVEDIEEFMASLDIFVLSSSWEGFGYVLVEAMSQAKPIVAYHVSSNPEIVLHEANGFLASYRDIKELTKYVSRLMEDAQLRERMGRQGLERARNQFEFHASMDHWETYLQTPPKTGR